MSQTISMSPASFLRSRSGRVCVALQARTIKDLLERAEAALIESQFLEFRLDCLETDKSGAAIAPIAEFLSHHHEVAAIATCRRKAHGGGFAGSLTDQMAVLADAAKSGFAIVDLEIESAEALNPYDLTTLRDSGTCLMISFHDFTAASDPEAAFTRIQRFSPDFVKIVNTAKSISDSVDLLEWIDKRSSSAQIIAIAMGEAGVVSRILSLRAGSAFTFAADPNGQATASGQMTARTLKDLYRIGDLDNATRIYGVAGNPVAHSLSPLMQNTAFRRERVNAVYLPLRTETLEDLLKAARALPLSGMSVTMPLKQTVMPHLANVDPMTAKLGACNTVRMGADGKLYGFNTDVAGIVRPLEKRLPLKNARILILGAGGAARAAVYGLQEKGARVYLWSRNETKAKVLASSAQIHTVNKQQIAANEFDILINATPCGMQGNSHSLPLDDNQWKARLVFDLVYNPLDTPLLQAARAKGAATVQGVEMFVHQGARQFELWTGKPAPEAEMLRVVLFALNKAQ